MRTQRVVSHQLLGDLSCKRGLEAASYVNSGQFRVFADIVRFDLGPLTLDIGVLRVRL